MVLSSFSRFIHTWCHPLRHGFRLFYPCSCYLFGYSYSPAFGWQRDSVFTSREDASSRYSMLGSPIRFDLLQPPEKKCLVSFLCSGPVKFMLQLMLEGLDAQVSSPDPSYTDRMGINGTRGRMHTFHLGGRPESLQPSRQCWWRSIRSIGDK